MSDRIPKEIMNLELALAVVDNAYSSAMEALMEALEWVRGDGQIDMPGLVDAGFLMREIENHCDDLRKEAKAKKNLVEMVIAKRAITDSVNEAGVGNIDGRLATGTPDVKQEPKMPKKGTAEYVALCQYFGLSEKAIRAGVMSPHYLRLGEWATEATKNGEPLPDGLLETRPKFTVAFRRKRQVG